MLICQTSSNILLLDTKDKLNESGCVLAVDVWTCFAND